MKILTFNPRAISRTLLLLGCLVLSLDAVQAQTPVEAPIEISQSEALQVEPDPTDPAGNIDSTNDVDPTGEAPQDTTPAEATPEEPDSEETETAPEESSPIDLLPAPPEPNSSKVRPDRPAPREPAVPPARPPVTQLTNPAEWEILSEPAKLPGTSLPPVVAPQSPLSGDSLSAIARQKNLALPLKDARIEILKWRRRLNLYSGNTLVKSYSISLGSNPIGHKQRQGDGRTPEGRYFICTRNATNSAFHIFLGLSYPAVPDAKRAVSNKQITWREYQLINKRLASRSAPLWETRLGGWVGIHGGTDDGFAQKKMRARGTRDWTAGCIALTNRQIEEIHAATKMGTPVDIRP